MSTVFSRQAESRTAMQAVQDFPKLIVNTDLKEEDLVVYGTSDPTINPAEVWLTSLVAEKCGAWEFFNYPLSDKWIRYDVDNLFAPYGFPCAYRPFDIVPELELGSIEERLTPHNLQNILPSDDEIFAKTLDEITSMIKDYRTNKSFVVVNFMEDNKIVRVYGSRKNKKLYRDKYSQWTVGELLSDRTIKLGGGIIYFLFGYYSARRSATVLFPNNVLGDVWGAVAAGVDAANNGCIKLYPIGGFDLMTVRQWACWRKTGVWKKAPAQVVKKLQRHSFLDKLLEGLLVEKRYCPVAYDEANEDFWFVDL